MDSKRQQIINAIITRFKTVLIANGYEIDLGQHVFDYKPAPWQSSEIPGVDIRENDKIERLIGQELHTMRVRCQCVSANDTNNSLTTPPEMARKIQAGIVKAVGVDITWGGLAEDTGLVNAEPADVLVGEQVFMGAEVLFEIQYVTGIMDSYN